MQDLIIISVLAICVGFVVFSMIKKKKKGLSPSCGCGCDGCSSSSSCGSHSPKI